MGTKFILGLLMATSGYLGAESNQLERELVASIMPWPMQAQHIHSGLQKAAGAANVTILESSVQFIIKPESMLNPNRKLDITDLIAVGAVKAKDFHGAEKICRAVLTIEWQAVNASNGPFMRKVFNPLHLICQ